MLEYFADMRFYLGQFRPVYGSICPVCLARDYTLNEDKSELSGKIQCNNRGAAA